MKTIQMRLFLYFLLLVLLPVIILGTYSYSLISDLVTKNINHTMQSSLEQIGKNVDYKLDGLSKYISYISTNQTLKDIMKQNDLASYDSNLYNSTLKLDKLFSSVFYQDEGSISTIVYDISSGGYYLYRPSWIDPKNLRNSEYYKETINLNGKIYWGGIYPNENKENNRNYFILGRMFKEYSDVVEFKNLGVVFILLYERELSNIYQNVENKPFGEILICNNSGYVISHDDKTMLSKNLKNDTLYTDVFKSSSGYYKAINNGQEVLVTFHTTSDFDMKIINIIPYEKYMSQMSHIKVMTTLLIGICIFLFLIISILFSRSISLPIKKLEHAMSNVEEGDFNVRVRTKRNDELGKMTDSFNYMVKRIDELFKKALNEEKLRNKYELMAFQYQINPHFINNVLATIRMQAMINDDSKVASMLQILGRMFVRTVKSGSFITIEEEIENIIDFVSIEQLQYNNKINDIYDIDPVILDSMIPNLLMQPIVENVFFHGFSPQMENPTIKIIGKCENDIIHISIEDNGKGMSKETCNNILGDNKIDLDNHSKHIGLKNVDTRIKLNFGVEYGLSIKSSVGSGSTIYVKIPYYIKEKEDIQ